MIFLYGQPYWFRDINLLDLTNFKIQVRHKTFLREHIYFILIDFLIDHIHFGSNQPVVSLNITTTAYLISVDHHTNNLTETGLVLLIPFHTCHTHFYAGFYCREGISCLFYSKQRFVRSYANLYLIREPGEICVFTEI